ncbi:MAG: hypothetical protein CM1200mP10_21330 [Candidatus Neomarinimicrobiota bacterium]|nr:MAG: hypothetical protein CM1200mP10_21330 [Candidatus Neomarinimicrobiota bacterium]
MLPMDNRRCSRTKFKIIKPHCRNCRPIVPRFNFDANAKEEAEHCSARNRKNVQIDALRRGLSRAGLFIATLPRSGFIQNPDQLHWMVQIKMGP